MFGLSIGKLLIIVLIAAVIWYGFKRIGGARARKGGGAPADGRVADGTQDLVACSTCGTYAPAPLTVCPSGRNDCPLLQHRA